MTNTHSLRLAIFVLACAALLSGCWSQRACDFDYYKTLVPQSYNWDGIQQDEERPALQSGLD